MPLPVDRMPTTIRSQGSRLNRLERALTELRAARRSAVLVPQDLELAAGWVPVGSNWQAPQYLLTGGMVHLIGAAAPGTLTVGTVITTLPAGTWPAGDHEFRVPGGSATAATDLLLTAATGTVSIEATSGTVTRISLSGLCWPAA
jgi:hypothetical protein